MKKSFVMSLQGKSVVEAESLVRRSGHTPLIVPEGCMAITGEAKPNTVVLWQKSGEVTMAHAGDTYDLVDDTTNSVSAE